MRFALKAMVMTFLLLAGAGAQAAEPLAGVWLTQEGDSKIRVSPCGKMMCAAIVWAKDVGTDEHNPDPELRKRSLIGVTLTRDMTPDASGSWSGSLYNPEDGKTYQGGMRLKGRNSLEISGCVLGVLCGSELWSRQSEETASAR